MPQAHLICRNHDGIKLVSMPNYTSSAWYIPEDEAKALIGGMIYFHEAKDQPSYFGGRITGYSLCHVEDDQRARIVIELTAVPEGRGQKWSGKKHDMAHYSGVC